MINLHMNSGSWLIELIDIIIIIIITIINIIYIHTPYLFIFINVHIKLRALFFFDMRFN